MGTARNLILVFALVIVAVVTSEWITKKELPRNEQPDTTVLFDRPEPRAAATTPTQDTAALLDERFNYRLEGVSGQSLGTVFEISAPGIHCGAGFVNAVQSHNYTNQNDLEFWCQENREPLVFYSLGKPVVEQTKSTVINLYGHLFERMAQKYWSNGAWRSLPRADLKRIGYGTIISVFTHFDNTWVVTSRGSCGGVSVYSDRGYHGTLKTPGAKVLSSVFVGNGQIYANIGNRLWAGAIPPASKSCSTIPMDKVNDDNVWVYAMLPVAEGFLYGGIDGNGCAPFYIVNNTVRKSENCPPIAVNEYYAFSAYEDGLLIGSYPDGTVMKLIDGELVVTDFAKTDEKTPYRESQSVVVAHGRVYIGMYPWAELFVYEDGTKDVYRMIPIPPRENGVMVPYEKRQYELALNAAEKIAGHEFKEWNDVPANIVEIIRIQNYYPNTWAQRLQAITVMDGEICMSTGNFDGSTYDPVKHALPPTAAELYGRILCALVQNQTLGRLANQAGQMRFLITATHLYIFENGKVIASTQHNLNHNALLALAGAKIKTGRGFYGEFQGSLSRID